MGGGGGGGGDPGGEGGADAVDLEATRQPTPIPLTYVVLAEQNLPRGFRIREDSITIKPWPIESGIQENAFVVPSEYYEDGRLDQEEINDYLNPELNENSPIGMVTRTRVARWQPILTSMVVEDLAAAADDVGSQTSAILPSGYVAIAVPIDMLGGVAYALADGDRVDVALSFLFVDVDETFQSIEPNIQSLVTISPEGIAIQQGVIGRFEASSILGVPVIIEPTEYQRPRLVTQRTIENALVVHVGEYPNGGDFLGVEEEETAPPAEGEAPVEEEVEEGTPVPTPVPPRPRVVTLGVSPQDAVALIWAMEAQTPITLMLRSAKDKDVTTETTQAVSLGYMVSNYSIERPPRLDYALEPRITEVRSVNAMLQHWEELWVKDITSGRSRGGQQGEE
jgi:Flp pilus assembly protein CpaB